MMENLNQQSGLDQQSGKAVAFIDTSIDNYQSLLQGIKSDVDVYLLNSNESEINQITAILERETGVSSVHIISHGSEGNLQLGYESLNIKNLNNWSEEIQSWSKALNQEADILFYGCNVAENEAGKSLINSIAELSGADVAASNDITGNAMFGGDWSLEYQTGTIEASRVFSAEGFSNLLQTFVVTNTNDSGVGSLRQAVLDANASSPGDADVIRFNLGSGSKQINLTSGELIINNQNLTIDGAASNLLKISGANKYEAFYVVGGSSLTISNVTLADGNGVRINKTGGSGGAISIDPKASAQINNSVLINNSGYSGGAISVSSGSSLTVNNTSFINNSTTKGGKGGAIDNYGTVTIKNSTFSGNQAIYSGGAINNYYANLTVNNTSFNDNKAGYSSGAIFNNGGKLTVDSSQFNRNSATVKGSGVGAAIGNSGTTNITNTSFNQNSAAGWGGGAIINYNGTTTLSGSSFTGNSVVDGDGGAINNYNGTTNVTDTNFTSNIAKNGGAIYNGYIFYLTGGSITKNTAYVVGGGIKDDYYLIVNSTTIVNNTAPKNPNTYGV